MNTTQQMSQYLINTLVLCNIVYTGLILITSTKLLQISTRVFRVVRILNAGFKNI